MKQLALPIRTTPGRSLPAPPVDSQRQGPRVAVPRPGGRGIRAAEFFAGMGLMRAGLERVGVTTVFANDIDSMKAALYRSNWGDDALVVDDICNLAGTDIPDVDVATASFPCVDMSLAGNLAGLGGERSGLITEFCRILEEMGDDRRPEAVIVENVPGFMTVNGGSDFACVVKMLESLGYEVTSVVVDARGFVPQSRARVFLLGSRSGRPSLPEPPNESCLRLVDVASDEGDWWVDERRDAFLESLSPLQRARVDRWRSDSQVRFFGAFRRTRNGFAVWEVRADEMAGALRTTRGGSSKQAIVRVGRGCFDVRWMSVVEYARLQGAEDLCYDSVSERQAMFALGDAVCVPVIEWLGRNWLTRVAA